jgi:hypothetical protein
MWKIDLEVAQEFSFDLVKYEVLYTMWSEKQILHLDEPQKSIWVRDRTVLKAII